MTPDPTTPTQVEADYCESVPGAQPHNYQPVVDFVAGTGIWLFCTQCGDYFNCDGTADPHAGSQPAAPSPLGSLAPTTAPATNTSPHWLPGSARP